MNDLFTGGCQLSASRLSVLSISSLKKIKAKIIKNLLQKRIIDFCIKDNF